MILKSDIIKHATNMHQTDFTKDAASSTIDAKHKMEALIMM